jgi:hypothetical protein
VPNLGPDVIEQRTSNSFLGAGPDVGVELEKHLDFCGLGLFAKLDGAYYWSHVGQNFGETLVPAGAAPVGVANHFTSSQGSAEICARAGLSWRPPRMPHLGLLLGYEFEYWYQMGRNDSTGSVGNFYENGIIFRAEFNF